MIIKILDLDVFIHFTSVAGETRLVIAIFEHKNLLS